MSRKLISKCDGCSIEIAEADDATPMGLLGMRRRHGSEAWATLHVFPTSFDLCEACTKRVVDLLELELPKPSAMVGGHAVPYVSPLDFGPGSRMAPPWDTPAPTSSPFGALTPDDLKALGIELPPGLMSTQPGPTLTPSTCANCGLAYKGPRPKICTTCGHVHDD